MDEKKLLRAIGDIDPRFLEEAEEKIDPEEAARARQNMYMRRGGLMTAAALVVLLGVQLLPGMLNSGETENPAGSDVPQTTAEMPQPDFDGNVPGTIIDPGLNGLTTEDGVTDGSQTLPGTGLPGDTLLPEQGTAQTPAADTGSSGSNTQTTPSSGSNSSNSQSSGNGSGKKQQSSTSSDNESGRSSNSGSSGSGSRQGSESSGGSSGSSQPVTIDGTKYYASGSVDALPESAVPKGILPGAEEESDDAAEEGDAYAGNRYFIDSNGVLYIEVKSPDGTSSYTTWKKARTSE